jgi:hypothetical protein
MSEKIYDCGACIHWYDCPSLGNIDQCPEEAKDKAAAYEKEMTCPYCHHYLIGKAKICPIPQCKSRRAR